MAQTILLVDDEPTLREAVAAGLRDEGYRVVEAEDGAQALELFRTDPSDLVLLDLMLPELSGMEVCRILRRESDVPIMMLTARDSELDKVVGLEVGADDYVTKPFSLRELVARVRALLRRSQSAGREQPAVGGGAGAEPRVRLGRVDVDLAGRRLVRDGHALPVKPKAFDLLAFLLRHRGQVFTREQLLEHVWGYHFAGETRTVDVHVHALRTQIEEDPRRPRLLETVRGVGYVLRPG